MSQRRWQLINRILRQRQPDLTVVMDGVHKPHNFSAVVRSCDAAGLLEAHFVPIKSGLTLSSGLAKSSQKWVSVRRHPTFSDVGQMLKERGFQLLAAHQDHNSIDFRDADYCRPSAIVLGAELHGVNDATLRLVDQTIHVPMLGMVESLNVSVACAVILYEAQRQREAAGMYRECRLETQRLEELRFEWFHPKIARHCRHHQLPYPAVDDQTGEIIGPLRGTAENPL